MKTIFLTAFAAAAITALASEPATDVRWETLGNRTDADGRVHYTQRFTVTGDTQFPRLAFNMFHRRMSMVNPADTLVEIFPGYYYVATPRLDGSDTVVIDIDVAAALTNGCYAADGVHRLYADGKTAPVRYTRALLTEPYMWATDKVDKMPYGPEVYKRNAGLATDWQPGPYDVIPSYKKVTPLPGESNIDGKRVFFNDIDPENPEYYRIRVSGDSLIVWCRPDRQWSTMMHFTGKVLKPNEGKALPNVEIEDWPDMPWRGLHVDISRNYQTPAAMSVVLQLLAANHMNKLHFHFADDEAWRLEIPGLPELTDVASRRGFSTDGEYSYLNQIFAGDGNPDTKEGSANGYWTRDEFIRFLQMAKTYGIDVLPEIESPGHIRAAIKAMERRHRDGDSSYRLIHDNDTSKYTSAQSYHDNVCNPALPGPYKFMGKVFDELIDMYREAGVPLIGIHIGGDEVPHGAWNGSEVAKKFMAEHGMTTEKELHAYFVRQIAQQLKDRGVPMYGWEEIAVGHGDDFNAVVAPLTGGVHCWHDNPEAAIKAIKGGFPVILGNVNRFYLDMSYSPHPEDQGLTWGGYVDEFDALHGYADRMCPVALDSVPGKLLGVQGQIWAETIRNPQQLYFMMLPKMLGLAERGWNTNPTWTDERFNAIIGEKELPVYKADPETTLRVRMRPAGIAVIDGLVHMNTPYSGGEIRYTVDGSEPTEFSPLYTAPFAPGDAKDIRARYYRNHTPSLTTYLRL